jgi:hypothetical protein
MGTFERVQRPAAARSSSLAQAERSNERSDDQAATPPTGWSFANVPLHAPPPTGSTALDTENEEGPVGQNVDTPSPLPTAPVKTPPPPSPVQPPGTSPPTPTPAGPTISSATVKAAPSGAANTRKDVGVGEVVDFTGSVAGTWTASAGTASGASSATFRWTAPATAATVTITLKTGTSTATDTINVVAPSDISMKNVGSHTAQVGAGGACMLTEVTILPKDVCLGAIQWLEVPGDGTSISGFFTKFSKATLHHDPNPDYAVIDDNNVMEKGPHNAPNDHCSWHTTPGPYKDGAYEWKIPNRYILDSEAASAGRYFCDTTQHYSMDGAGKMTITKAGATT